MNSSGRSARLAWSAARLCNTECGGRLAEVKIFDGGKRLHHQHEMNARCEQILTWSERIVRMFSRKPHRTLLLCGLSPAPRF